MYGPLGSGGFLIEKAHPSVFAVFIRFHMLSTDSLRLTPSCLIHFKHRQKHINLGNCVNIYYFSTYRGNVCEPYLRNIWKRIGRNKFILSLALEIVSQSDVIKAHAWLWDTWRSLVRRNKWYFMVGARAVLVFRGEWGQRLEEARHIAERVLRLGTKVWAGIR